MKTLLEKIRAINHIVQDATGHSSSFTDMAETLQEILEANVYILNSEGKILGNCFIDNFDCPTMKDIVKFEGLYPGPQNEDLLKINEPQVNIIREGICVFCERTCQPQNKYTTVIPILGGGERLGTLMLSKSEEFDDSDLVLAEVSATVIGMELLKAKVEEVEAGARQRSVVSIAFDTLSFSELEAVEHIFEELGGSEGLLVASKVADKVGITRSVIVNALRKLESAGLIEVRSLGMKGTYIRVLNDYVMVKLDRMKSSHHKD